MTAGKLGMLDHEPNLFEYKNVLAELFVSLPMRSNVQTERPTEPLGFACCAPATVQIYTPLSVCLSAFSSH